MNIIFLGAPGSGKGTQATKLAEELSFFYLSTGQMFRDMSEKRPDIAEMMKKGLLVPDDTVITCFKEYLEEKGIFDNTVIDGTPRSVYQYNKIQSWLKKKGKKIDLAILLDISKKESIRRLSARRQDKLTGKIYNLITDPPGPKVDPDNLIQRADDKPETIQKRFEEYYEDTAPLVKVLEKDGILMKVDGERPIEIIFQDILTRLGIKK